MVNNQGKTPYDFCSDIALRQYLLTNMFKHNNSTDNNQNPNTQQQLQQLQQPPLAPPPMTPVYSQNIKTVTNM